MVSDVHIGTGIHQAQELSAGGGVAHVHYCRRDISHHFIGVNERVNQRIGQGNQQEEYQYTLVLEHLFQLVRADMRESAEALPDNISE